jgi:hypothetical protein
VKNGSQLTILSREYAERFFPSFVEKLDKELAEARKRSEETLRDKNWQHESRTSQVARLALEGKNRAEILQLLGINSRSGVNTYIHQAKKQGLLPKDFDVPVK